MIRTILAGGLAIAAAFTLTACEDEFKGSGAAIDHCKDVATRRASHSPTHTFSGMTAKDHGGGEWTVTGNIGLVTLDGTDVTRPVTCDVYMDKGMSDGADVRATIG